MKMLLSILCSLIFLGCQLVNPFSSLSPWGIPSNYSAENSIVESVDNVNIVSPEFEQYIEGRKYTGNYKTYTVESFLIQPIEVLWSANAMYAEIFIKNTTPIPQNISIDKVTFMPLGVHKKSRNIEKKFKPFISVVYYDDEIASEMIIPHNAPGNIPYSPSKLAQHDVIRDDLTRQFEVVDNVVRGEVSSIELSPDSIACIQLYFHVGYIKSGILRIPFSEEVNLHLEFK